MQTLPRHACIGNDRREHVGDGEYGVGGPPDPTLAPAREARQTDAAERGPARGTELDGDPSYVTFDDAIAQGLGLNMKAFYSGSESAELTEGSDTATRTRSRS